MVRKPLVAASLVLTCAAALSAVGGAAQAAQSPAVGGGCTSTAQTIYLTSLIWSPASVLPGQSSEATATAVNCTNVTQSAGEEWLGRFVGPTGGFPAGCPVIDPYIRSIALPPHAIVSDATGYLVPSGCTATGLIVTVDILQNGVVVSTRSAELIVK